MSHVFEFRDIQVVSLDELISSKAVELGRGNIISKVDIRNNQGNFPIYSSSARNGGKMGEYGKYMFDEELITWSIDGGGNFFYRKKHKFSVTNVSGYMRINQNKFDYKFFHYILDHQHKYLRFDYQSKAHPSVIRELYEVPLLPIGEQRKISQILSSVDSLLEDISLELEKISYLKNALISDLLTKGLTQKKSKKSEIGDVPFDWEIKSLNDICKMHRGKFSHRPRNDPRFFNGNIPFIQTGDVPKEKFEIENYTQTLNEEGLKVSKLFKKDTLVMTIAANIGEVGILKFDSCFPDSLIGIETNSEIDSVFLLLSLKHHKRRLEEVAPKNAQSNLNLEILSTFKLPIPDIKTQKDIAKIIVDIENHRLSLHKMQESYSYLKNSLMQDLLTGKVRVKVN